MNDWLINEVNMQFKIFSYASHADDLPFVAL
jgi:hypothetical protein